jgi:hypothetical protein
VGDLKGDEEKDYADKTINGFKTSLKMFYKLRHPCLTSDQIGSR